MTTTLTSAPAPLPIPDPSPDAAGSPAPRAARPAYRCRLCRDLFIGDEAIPDGEALLAEALAAARVGLPPTTVVHRCGVKLSGLADLVGVQATGDIP